jgi:hypothetical protein
LLIYLSMSFALIIIAVFSFRFFSVTSEFDLKTLDPSLYDQSWFTGNPCMSPCWYGLIPGKSSRNDAISTAKHLHFINMDKVEVHSQRAFFPCKVPDYDNQDCIRMSFDNDILDTLWLTPNYKITFEQAVEKLGNPDGFSLYPTNPGATGCYFGVIWKEKQLILEQTADRPFWGDSLCQQIIHSDGKIPKNILVESAVISLPSYLENMMNFKPWKGFLDK